MSRIDTTLVLAYASLVLPLHAPSCLIGNPILAAPLQPIGCTHFIATIQAGPLETTLAVFPLHRNKATLTGVSMIRVEDCMRRSRSCIERSGQSRNGMFSRWPHPDDSDVKI
jgi:hypothetical protein